MKLGMFDPPELNPYTSIPPEVVNCPEHQVHCTYYYYYYYYYYYCFFC